jgi:anaerobic magnesium-protoporphyrin IX monomethyl ester cyclase
MSSSLTKDMDVGVTGEGEETICELLELLARKGKFDKDDLLKIKGIIYWDNGKIATTDGREPIYPLDELPLPARDLFSIQPNTYMFTSRGCPYRCTFCASSRFWSKVRIFSAEYLVKEIEHLVKVYDVKSIMFYDDIFSVDVQRVRKTIDLLKEKNILGKVDFNCSIRANMVNDETIKLLKELGVKSIGMGLESGCNRTLKYLKRDNIDIKDNENAIRIIKKHGIEVHGSFIIGSPEEDRKDILETLKFIKKNQLTGFDVYVLTPFPGTPVWDYALSRGLVAEEMDWDRLNVDFSDNYDSAIILSEKLTRKEIHALFLQFRHEQRKTAIYRLVRTGLRNPSKILGFLNRKFIKRSGK